MLDHRFNGPPFTIGLEEELMLLNADDFSLAQAIETILAAVPPEREGQVKPELMQSVLEIATKPCQTVGEAGEELRALRRMLTGIAEERGLRLAASGTHPFGRWEDQEIVDRPRYLELIEELGFIARRELIFGTHVHVAIDGPDRAIYVADGIRLFLPLLLALSANSPFWRGNLTGMMSSRTPVFRGFPRAGVPPHYGTWEIYSHRVEQMMRGGAARRLSHGADRRQQGPCRAQGHGRHAHRLSPRRAAAGRADGGRAGGGADGRRRAAWLLRRARAGGRPSARTERRPPPASALGAPP